MRALFVAVLIVGTLWAVSACSATKNAPPKTASIAPPPRAATQPSNYAGLHNVVAYGDTLYSGAVPEGAEGFETLRDMGVKTIISVDGATPEVELAKKYGLRYVHLPIGYNGMTDERKLEIARAVQDLPGPVYIHCHHGKHRSAAAAGAAAVSLGMLTREQALAEMKVSGTAANYTGLWACVQEASPVSKQRLATVSNAFPETTKIGDFAEMMVHVDETFDHLKAVEKAGWKVPADHPDLVPAAEAGKLADLFRNAPQPKAKAQTEEFGAWMRIAADRVATVEKSLLSTATSQQLSDELKLVAQSCTQCHAKYRD
jgi:protein tyrosine phosphatase (PTP) superfamily phosphohydrolase (DUF442 family)